MNCSIVILLMIICLFTCAVSAPAGLQGVGWVGWGVTAILPVVAIIVSYLVTVGIGRYFPGTWVVLGMFTSIRH